MKINTNPRAIRKRIANRPQTSFGVSGRVGGVSTTCRFMPVIRAINIRTPSVPNSPSRTEETQATPNQAAEKAMVIPSNRITTPSTRAPVHLAWWWKYVATSTTYSRTRATGTSHSRSVGSRGFGAGIEGGPGAVATDSGTTEDATDRTSDPG